jgi:hypothetical protein
MYDGQSIALAKEVQTFFDLAVTPACTLVANELASFERGPDDESIDRWDALRETQLELHRTFALGIGAMWERHFRQHLSHSISILLKDREISEVERADWKKLCKLFEEARGFPLTKFPSYPALELLHRTSSAVRHGNGKTSESMLASNPELFGHEPIRSYWTYFLLGGEPDHSIHKLDISFDHLVTFKEAVVDFWRMIRALQLTDKS